MIPALLIGWLIAGLIVVAVWNLAKFVLTRRP